MKSPRVISDPDILGGTPVFIGTRVPVRIIFEHLEAGDSLEVFLEDFPSVSRELAVQVLVDAKDALVVDLEAEVLGLPPEDRARLLERLIASFEPQSSAQRAWVELAHQRQADAKAGRVAMVPGDEALKRVRARLA